MKLSLENVYELMDKLSASGLGEVSVESEDVKISIKAKAPAPVMPAAQMIPSPQFAPGNAPVPAAQAETAQSEPCGIIVKSPIVGTFYATSGPDKDPFVCVGDSVKKGDILFIIESMKLMNEIGSDFDGKIAEIFLSSGDPVEFGQPVMRIE